MNTPFDISGFARNIIVLLFLIAILIVFSLTIPGFLSFQNFDLILRQVAVLGVMACGLTMVILSGGIDLSVGALMALSVNLVGIGIKNDMPVLLAYPLILATGLLLGFSNGFLVSRLSVPPIIVTLATMNIFRGITIVVTDGIWVSPIPSAYLRVGQGFFPVIILGLVVLSLALLESTTRFGRNILAMGGNLQAAVFSGVPVRKNTVVVYGLCGFLCALAGIVFMGRSGNIQPQVGMGWEMNAIAAIVIGGTSIWGGSGSVSRTLLGTLLMGVILAGFTMYGINPYWEGVVTGSLIIMAIILDSIRVRYGEQE